MTSTLVTAALLMLLVMSSLLGFVIAHHTGPRARFRSRVAGIGGGTSAPAAKQGGAPLRRTRQIRSKLAEAFGTGGAKRNRRIELRLLIDRAGLSTSVRAFYLWSALSAVLATVAYFGMGFSWYFAWAVLLVMGVGFPRKVLRVLAGRRQRRFTRGFADAIDVMVRGMRSGLPVGECLTIIARESPEPVAGEFKLIVEGQRLGMTLKQALERSCRAMPTADMKFFAIVLNLQQQTGGNLAETLSGLSDVLRQRKKMADKVRSMSAEARMTAGIIGSMPFLISLMIYLIDPGYIALLWTDSLGKKILYGGLTWMSIGIFIMKQMVSFEI